MPAASYTESAFSDLIQFTFTRTRTGPSTLDWTINVMIASVQDASGNIIKANAQADVANLLSGANMTTLKGFLNTAVSNAASARSIATNT